MRERQGSTGHRGKAESPTVARVDTEADMAAQVGALTFPIANDAKVDQPRRRHSRFHIGTVNGVDAFYTGEELHVDEERLLRLMLQTADIAGAKRGICFPGEMLVRWRTGEVNEANIRLAREALLRLSEIIVDFAQECGVSPPSELVQSVRAPMVLSVQMLETIRRTEKCPLTVCNVVLNSVVMDFMIEGRPPWSDQESPPS